MVNPKISVVIAFHNGSRWIERAIESAVAQTVTPNEIIVVDDGSSQSESKFLEPLIARYGIRVIRQENSGQSSARNAGVAAAASDFVCLLDQDDYFLPRHIEILLNAADLADSRFAFSYGDLWRANEAGQVLTHSCVNVESQHPHTSIRDLVSANMYILPSATLINRERFLEIGGFDPDLRGYEDDDLFLRFFVAGYTNRFTPEPVTVWTINTTSTSFSEAMARSRFLYFKKLLALFPEGSVMGTAVFGELLVRRFALHLADDVVASAFRGDEYFQERLSRLVEFRDLVRNSKEVSSAGKRRYLFATYPLVTLGSKFLRIFLLVITKSRILLIMPGLAGRGHFVKKYLPGKKSLAGANPMLGEKR